MTRLGCGWLVGPILLGACSRTPPEPAPPPPLPVAVEASVRTTSTSARCLAKWPAESPKLPAAAMSCPVDPEASAVPKLAHGEVRFPDAPAAPPVDAEIAKSRFEVERGLMYRRSMGENDGMIFKLDGRRDHTFWMHNTCIALDMLFIDDDGVIVGIVEGAEPLTDSTRSVGCPSVFVLELNAGWARRHGLAPGQKVAIPFSAR